jgi:hypothetical protein
VRDELRRAWRSILLRVGEAWLREHGAAAGEAHVPADIKTTKAAGAGTPGGRKEMDDATT